MPGSIAPRTRFPTVGLAALQTLLWLALLQALRALFSALFGVVYDAVFAETLGIGFLLILGGALLLAFLSPLLGGRLGLRGTAMAVTIAMLARIPVSLDLPPLRLWAALLTVAAAFVALTTFLRRDARRSLAALVLALLLDQLLRAAGSTWDLSLRPAWWLVQIPLTLVSVWLAWSLAPRPRPGSSPASLIHQPGWLSAALSDDSSLRLAGSLALAGLLFLQLNLLSLPNALARWSGSAYAWLAPALWVASLSGIWLGQALRPDRGHRALLTALLVTGLGLGHLAPAALSALGLLLAAAVSVALLSALPSPTPDHKTGLGLALGNMVFLILSFGLAFAFTYPYTLSALRDTGIAWYLVAALLTGLAVLGQGMPELSWPWRRWGMLGVLGLLLVGWLAGPVPPPELPARAETLRLATYNIHYGYDGPWHLSLARQADTLEAAGVDVVALQEVDTGRITSYSIDDALWLGRRLGMHVIYLPTVEHLTGIALLSRYPLLEAEMTLLPSQEEQTGLIRARLLVGGKPVDVFATWLGLSEAERARQITAALAWMPERSPQPTPVCFAGDLNSSPGSPTYRRLAEAGFSDPFRTLGLGDVPTDPALLPRERIDYTWLRTLTPLAAGVPGSLASDHRPVWVEVQVPP
jgi:endonuclease/exonuclease/phosphatase family metal-dependent hydrolase